VRHNQRTIAAVPEAEPRPARAITINRRQALDLLKRLEPQPTPLQLSAVSDVPAGVSGAPRADASPEARWNRAVGCKTSDVALTLLAQLVSLEHPAGDMPDAQVDATMVKAQAMLAELEPTTATEALLATEMVGAQQAAMTFLARSLAPGQAVELVDRNVNRATKLIRLFNEQIDAMAKLKEKGGPQRVVVEHVTVAAGGDRRRGNPGGWRGAWLGSVINPMNGRR
jgi:hypothetical protein